MQFLPAIDNVFHTMNRSQFTKIIEDNVSLTKTSMYIQLMGEWMMDGWTDDGWRMVDGWYIDR